MITPLVPAAPILATRPRWRPPSPAELVARLGGPVFAYELVRLARRGSMARLRVLYGLAVLTALAVTYFRWFPDRFTLEDPFAPARVWRSPGEQARFAESFAVAVLVVQWLAALVLAPAHVAGAVADERQRSTLDDLLASDLTAGEIIRGKLAARLLYLGGVLLVGLPALALTQLFGGVDPRLLGFGFGFTALTLWSVGALGVYCSVRARTVTGAVTAAYAVVIAFCGITYVLNAFRYASPFRVLHDASSALGRPAWSYQSLAFLFVAYAAWHGLLGLGLTWQSVRELRVNVTRRRKATGLSGIVETWWPRPRPRPRPRSWPPADPRPDPPPPVDGDRPLFWKEQYFGGPRLAGPSLTAASALAAAAVVVLSTYGMAEVVQLVEGRGGPPRWTEYFNAVVRGLTVALFAGGGWAVALYAAGTVSRERERRTLDALLTLPGDRAAILRAKWCGSLLRARPVLAALAAVWAFGLVGGGLHPAALPFLAASGACYAGFAASLGLFLSAYCRSTARATSLVGVVLAANFLLPWLIFVLGGQAPTAGPMVGGTAVAFLADGLTPPVTWWNLAYSWGDTQPVLFGGFQYVEERLAAVLAGAAAYTLASWWLWRSAGRLLNGEEGRAPAGAR